jgi:hypothetical protein
MNMNEKHTKSIHKLVNNCANYNQYTNECILLDTKCAVLCAKTCVLCKYYIDYILPLDTILQAEILQLNKKETSLYIKNCKCCNATFKTTTRNNQYCDRCKEKQNKKRYKTYNRKKK